MNSEGTGLITLNSKRLDLLFQEILMRWVPEEKLGGRDGVEVDGISHMDFGGDQSF